MGADCGGTSTRAVLATVRGTILGRGSGGAGNPVARSASRTTTHLGSAIREALGGYPPDQVSAAVVGVAGAGGLEREAAGRAYAELFQDLGLAGVQLVA